MLDSVIGGKEKELRDGAKTPVVVKRGRSWRRRAGSVPETARGCLLRTTSRTSNGGGNGNPFRVE